MIEIRIDMKAAVYHYGGKGKRFIYKNAIFGH
jgi:hypothetical protein